MKMKPITQDQKEKLEEKLGFRICPLTAEVIRPEEEMTEVLSIFDFVYHIGGQVHLYKCAENGGPAEERVSAAEKLMVTAATTTPCSEEFAKERCGKYMSGIMEQKFQE